MPFAIRGPKDRKHHTNNSRHIQPNNAGNKHSANKKIWKIKNTGSTGQDKAGQMNNIQLALK